MRRAFLVCSVLILLLIAGVSTLFPPIAWSLVIIGPIILIGLYDMLQKSHAILRNFPIAGHFRFIFEAIRPEISQYFIESDTNGVPFSREQRSIIYQRAKKELDTVPFGTKYNVYETGYEWVNHSLQPIHLDPKDLRISIGGPDCRQPYLASLVNISAMSYGSLSKNAIQAFNLGAKIGNFAHNTGEGGISPYHLESGGDLIWQIGTAYFGCRTEEGDFSPENFRKRVSTPNVKMVEIKISQGAKPGHGGILPAAKLTPEIAEIRDVPLGQDVLSPPAHSAFKTPIELLEFIAKLRDLSDHKPIGFKLCVGKRREFIAIAKAMVKTGITPDFITVDGGEGGTGAAPLEFTNCLGAPLTESLIFVHNTLKGYGLRDQIKIISSGKITSAFHLVKHLALGADACNVGRGMMMALGCIQALKCNSNHCPVGVTTQRPELVAGLVVSDKSQRVANYHAEMIKSTSEFLGAMGLTSPSELHPWHIMRRTDPTETKHYGEIYEFLKNGDLLDEQHLPATYRRAVLAASPDAFTHTSPD